MEEPKKPNNIVSKHPVITNALIIIVIAVLGIWIVYFSLALFTKHGKSDKVPGVENMTYTEAINILHDHGFQVDIRDSLYKDDVRPGYVIEQFPKANSIVKPGRKIFLYINAVHPKEVVIDDDNHPMEDALRSYSVRSGLAKLQELGFKNVRIQRVLGADECIIKLVANGITVKKMQKVPVNANIIVMVSDGHLSELRDSLQNEELINTVTEEDGGYGGYMPGASYNPGYNPSETEPSSTPVTVEEEEEIEFF